MAKKKVMKTVSVPTLQEVEVVTCDICGKDVGDYRWWMSMETDDGCIGEFYLDIDVGHFESEQFTPEIFYEIIQKKFPTFAIHLSKKHTNPINYF